MEKKPAIYYELNELISTVNDVEFMYEIKHQIEEHQQAETADWADELTEEELADLNKLADEPIEKDTISHEELIKSLDKWLIK